MEALVFETEPVAETSNQQHAKNGLDTLPLSSVKEWIKARISRERRSRNSTCKVSLALVDASHRGWTWSQRRDNLQAPVREVLDCLRVPGEFCWFTSASVQYNSFPDRLETKALDDVDLDQEARYAIACETFGIAWIYFASSESTVAIAWSANEDYDLIHDLLEGVKEHRSIMSHRLLFGMLASLAMLKINKGWTTKNRQELFRAQADSGYHAYEEDRLRPILRGDHPATLSVKVSGVATHIAITELCLLGLQSLLCFLMEENDEIVQRQNPDDSAVSQKAIAYLRAQVKYFGRETAAALQNTRASQKKASIVVQGLFSLIARQDQEMSIQIAKDSVEIAQASKRDSTSMKAIAGVTMVFLPGTFLASFFSMPLFELSSGTGKLVAHQVWLYWSITIPLTLLTLAIYSLWVWANASPGSKAKLRFLHRLTYSDTEKLQVNDLRGGRD